MWILRINDPAYSFIRGQPGENLTLHHGSRRDGVFHLSWSGQGCPGSDRHFRPVLPRIIWTCIPCACYQVRLAFPGESYKKSEVMY